MQFTRNFNKLKCYSNRRGKLNILCIEIIALNKRSKMCIFNKVSENLCMACNSSMK